MQKMKLVVVGNGMAGMRVVEELLKIAPDIYDIMVFGDEPYPNYNRIMLSPVLANEQTINDIILNTREWYAENNIALHTSARINKIDRKNRIVTAEDGTTAEYDRLLLATTDYHRVCVRFGGFNHIVGIFNIAITNHASQISAWNRQHKRFRASG